MDGWTVKDQARAVAAARDLVRAYLAQADGDTVTFPAWVRHCVALLDAEIRVATGICQGREEAAQVADAEERLRKERMDSGDPNWGDPIAQGHKALTAVAIAKAIRALSDPALGQEVEHG